MTSVIFWNLEYIISGFLALRLFLRWILLWWFSLFCVFSVLTLMCCVVLLFWSYLLDSLMFWLSPSCMNIFLFGSFFFMMVITPDLCLFWRYHSIIFIINYVMSNILSLRSWAHITIMEARPMLGGWISRYWPKNICSLPGFDHLSKHHVQGFSFLLWNLYSSFHFQAALFRSRVAR